MGGTPTLPVPGQPAPLAPGEFVGASVPQVYSFLVKNVTPPSILYIQRDDVLVVEVASWSAAPFVTFSARLLEPTGVVQVIQQRIGPPTGAATLQVQIPLMEGFLLTAAASSNGAPTRGHTFVRAFINRGAVRITEPFAFEVLFADYVTDNAPVGWPGGRVVSQLEGPGFLQRVAATTPVAGADFTYTVLASSREKIRCVRAVLATSAVAGNRTPSFRVSDGLGNVLASSGNNNTQIAGQTVGYTLGIGMSAAQAAAAEFIAPLPGELLLPASSTITSVTGGLLVGDQWNPINVLVERWVALENV